MEEVITVDLKPRLSPRGAHYDTRRPVERVQSEGLIEDFRLYDCQMYMELKEYSCGLIHVLKTKSHLLPRICSVYVAWAAG